MRSPVFLFALLLLVPSAAFCQQVANPDAISKLINAGNNSEASLLLNKQLKIFYQNRNADTLPAYLESVGRIAQSETDIDGGVKAVSAYVKKIKSFAPQLKTLRKSAIEAGYYYGENDRNKMAFDAFFEAYRYTQQMPGRQPAQLAHLEMNLGTYADRMGNIALSQLYARKALSTYASDEKTNPEDLYKAYNNMGGQMYYASKLDSASYFFTKALSTVNKLPITPENQYYRPAVINNNLAGIYGLQGNTTKAISTMKSTIGYLNQFLASKIPDAKKKSALSFQFQAIDNLAGIYKELGDLQQAASLLTYSYQQKKKNLDPHNPELFKSQVLLGQLYFAAKELSKSEDYLRTGLAAIKKTDGDYTYWQADAVNTLALLSDERGNKKVAAQYYQTCDSLYHASVKENWDNVYLDFLRNAALFYAENGDPKTGIAKAKKGYQYVVKTGGAKTLPAFYQLLNLSEVCYRAGKYGEAITYADKGIDVVNKLMSSADNTLDSIKIGLKKPRAILTKAKAGYALSKKRDVPYLKSQLILLDEALLLLERRKSLLNDPEDVGVLLSDHAALLEFVKKINLDLYRLTNDPQYIGSLIGLHESALYSRIRARLDANDTLRFANVPPSVSGEEQRLKAALSEPFLGSMSHEQKLKLYIQATEEWNGFKERLKASYPRYYALRYGSIFLPLGDLQRSLPAATTVIRYFFTGGELLALVADKEHTTLVSLGTENINEAIKSFSQKGMNSTQMADLLQQLYAKLWAPLVSYVRHSKVIIIPDGILYNLNFELLTPERIAGYQELAAKSLLAKYTISYHYSLFVLTSQHQSTNPANQFIAYAPGFSDELKVIYKQRTKDSFATDRGYLKLLPQPFTVMLASKIKGLLGGKALINEASTEASFKANAGNHKIIHIGTHAESNNLFPNYSRLIFAKDPNDSEGDNSLFLPEIYNCDLVSNLTVLTACESGMPGYKDGEGMISLAHAFNYAGSESILTGLWKIDEQASAMIMESFYKNLLAGQPKDEALRSAKLKFLANADTRMLAPQYWAGLVLMGDTAPIHLEEKKLFQRWSFMLGGLAASALFIGLLAKTHRKRNLKKKL